MTINNRTRNLILAAEIAGYLHDLGKLHPGFADEKLKNGKEWPEGGRASTGIAEAHGKILEEGRIYPAMDEIADNPGLDAVLRCLRADPAWAAALALPAEWILPNTIQASGLGSPLRQHHATGKFPTEELSFLGDLYAFGADIRDSALDKGSGGAEGNKQDTATAEISNTLGHPLGAYTAHGLAESWRRAIGILGQRICSPKDWVDLPATRRAVLGELGPVFEQALGETRRPTNDVTLHHHTHSTASFLKAAMAEGALRQDFKGWQDDKGLFDLACLGKVRFRLLGVRWDWAALTRGMLSPVALVSLSGRRREVVDNLRELFEVEAAVGNLIYEDDDGVLILAPGFHEEEAARSEALFAEHVLDPLAERIATAIEPLGSGTAYRLCWSAPALYLTDYAMALGLDATNQRQRLMQAGEVKLRTLWDTANARKDSLVQICPQCGLRPAETREFALTESAVRTQSLCDECGELADQDAKRARGRYLANELGFRPDSYNLEELAKAGGGSRIALLSVRINPGDIANGHALVTQLARPIAQITTAKQLGIHNANALGDWFNELLNDLRAGKAIGKDRANNARGLLGDVYWLKETDGRGSALEVAEGFFLRESASLPAEWGLLRHDGDRLCLFAMRKHASPARLQRLWDDMRGLWKDVASDLAGGLDGRLVPLTLDARGLRLAVAASDADTAVGLIEARLAQSFSKVRGGFTAHVSCVVMRAKFPLYLALDALERLERRIPLLPRQSWTLESNRKSDDGQRATLVWSTPQGPVRWVADLATGDPNQPDLWHPHVIAASRRGNRITGPDRIAHVSELLPGDVAMIPPMTFDFLVLEGSARRYQLHYRQDAEELRRSHWVMGRSGRPPLLLESFPRFSGLLRESGWEVGKAKRLLGEMVETYEKWVRDVPDTLRDTGRAAWHAHLRNMLLRHMNGDADRRERLFNTITDGRFFDAVEWSTFVSKQNAFPSEVNA